MTPPPQDRPPPLPTVVRVVLWGQVILALLWGALVMVEASGAGGWADLVRIVGAILVTAYLVAVGLTALLARLALRQTAHRVAVALVLPPLATWLFFLIAR